MRTTRARSFRGVLMRVLPLEAVLDDLADLAARVRRQQMLDRRRVLARRDDEQEGRILPRVGIAAVEGQVHERVARGAAADGHERPARRLTDLAARLGERL